MPTDSRDSALRITLSHCCSISAASARPTCPTSSPDTRRGNASAARRMPLNSSVSSASSSSRSTYLPAATAFLNSPSSACARFRRTSAAIFCCTSGSSPSGSSMPEPMALASRVLSTPRQFNTSSRSNVPRSSCGQPCATHLPSVTRDISMFAHIHVVLTTTRPFTSSMCFSTAAASFL